MRKEDIVEIIYERLKEKYSRNEIYKIINEFLEIIKESLVKHITIELRGFGTFLVKKRKPRKVKNPKTGEIKERGERYVPDFKPGVIIKKIVETGNYHKITKKRRET